MNATPLDVHDGDERPSKNMPTASAASWSSCSIVKPPGTYTRVPGASTLRNSQRHTHAPMHKHAQTRANKHDACCDRRGRESVKRDMIKAHAQRTKRHAERRGEETSEAMRRRRTIGTGRQETQAVARKRLRRSGGAAPTAPRTRPPRGSTSGGASFDERDEGRKIAGGK